MVFLMKGHHRVLSDDFRWPGLIAKAPEFGPTALAYMRFRLNPSDPITGTHPVHLCLLFAKLTEQQTITAEHAKGSLAGIAVPLNL